MEKYYFIDMDGTIAEWKKAENEDVLKKPGYFRNLKPTKFVDPLRKFAMEHRGQVFILSKYLGECTALQDKDAWLDQYMPEIDKSARLFVPYEAEKVEYVCKSLGIPSLTENMILFDDYSPNLHAWKNAGGTGIKCYNGINGTKGTWKGDGAFTASEIIAKFS